MKFQHFVSISFKQTNFDILKFSVGPRLRGIKQKKQIILSPMPTGISFVLFP